MSLEKMIDKLDPWVTGCLPEYRLSWIFWLLGHSENDFYNYILKSTHTVTPTAKKESEVLKQRDDEILERALMDSKDEIDSMSIKEVYDKVIRYRDTDHRIRPAGESFHPMLLDPLARVDFFFCSELPAWTKRPVMSCNDGVYTCEELTAEDLRLLEETDQALFQRSGGWYNQLLVTPEEKIERHRIFGKCKALYPRKILEI